MALTITRCGAKFVQAMALARVTTFDEAGKKFAAASSTTVVAATAAIRVPAARSRTNRVPRIGGVRECSGVFITFVLIRMHLGYKAKVLELALGRDPLM